MGSTLNISEIDSWENVSENATAEVYTSTGRSLEASVQDTDGACINPFVQDAQSWACDCFEEMISSCTALVSEAGAAGNGGTVVSHELCMRARICEHPRICSSW